MGKMNQNVRVLVVLLLSGVVCAVLAASAAYYRLQTEAITNAGEEAKLLMDRAVQMFVVSTVKFDKEVNEARTEEEKRDVHARWFATILAVDDAVTHDFGAGQSRIRLIGDMGITGAAPLGGENTKIVTPFEREALTALKADPKGPYVRIDSDFFRIAAALPAGAHPGCRTCHNMANNANYAPETVLGSLNAYIPLGAHISKAKTDAWILGLGLMALFVLFSLGISYWVVHTITRPLGGDPSAVQSALKEMTNGNLQASIAVPEGDHESVMKSLETMQLRWREILRGIDGNVSQLNRSAQLIQGSASEVASASQEQNDATSETAAATEEMTVGIAHISENTQQAKQVAEESARLAGEGQELTHVAVGEIDAISTHVREFEGRIDSLAERSQQISSITNVIKDIADQTNLLALNAAIEAARAGETGRGFAVVADEVRKLAERTTASTTEIRAMIEAIQQETETTGQMMGESRKRIDQGVDAIKRLVEPLKQLRDGNQRAAQQLSDLSDATHEQSSAATTVAQHIESIASVSDRNANAAQEVASAADQLRVIAQELDTAIRRFKY